MEDFLNHKHYKHYKAQDFIWDEAFRSWVLEAKPEDTLYWTRFIMHFPDKEAEISLAKDIILHMAVTGPDLPDVQAQKIVDTVMQRTGPSASDLGANNVDKPMSNRWKAPMLIGVSILSILTFAVVLFNHLGVNNDTHHMEIASLSHIEEWMGTEHGQLIEKTNTSAHKKEIVLADGSEITLESGSSIRYAPSFSSNGFREIYLMGSAFFNVAKDSSRPFLVYANGIVTKVLGTSFRIYAPENVKEQAIVEVVSGVVAVYPMGNRKPKEVITKNKIAEVILTRNQKAEYSKADNNLITALVDNPIPIGNKLEVEKFIDYPILKIVEMLGLDYGIEIIHDNELLVNRTLTADLSGLTMYQKLDVVCQAINARYEVIDGKVVIL